MPANSTPRNIWLAVIGWTIFGGLFGVLATMYFYRAAKSLEIIELEGKRINGNEFKVRELDFYRTPLGLLLSNPPIAGGFGAVFGFLMGLLKSQARRSAAPTPGADGEMKT